jgi:alpha-ketoglutarate-dependent taurine dioxygenase
MTQLTPSGKILGATIAGLDLSKPLTQDEFALVVRGLGTYGVICFPRQRLDPEALKAFSARFGTLEVNVIGSFQERGLPEVMTLSNIVEDGKPIGLPDAGQDWHTDMSYSKTIAFANVLYGMRIPHRDGCALGNTEFLSMQAAYDDLPGEIKERLRHATALHDFNKYWEKARRQPGSTRKPLSEAQRREKPPVSHPVFLKHPVSGRMILYANPGYTVRINGMTERESDELLDFLFQHQLQPKYRYSHQWSENDVLMWDDLLTLHKAVADYGPDEYRLIKRCQVMADRVFDEDYLSVAPRILLGAGANDQTRRKTQ